MAKWILECTKCKFEFEHAQVNDVGMANFYLPLRPELSKTLRVCPNCGHADQYDQADLRYRG